MYCLKIILLLSFLSAFFIQPTQAQNIIFQSHFISPFSYKEKNEIKGFAVDVVRAMMKCVGHPDHQIVMVPFKRGLRCVQEDEKKAFFVVAMRPERKNTVKWVGPLLSSSVYFYKKKDAPLSVQNLKEAMKIGKIGVGLGNADHTYLESKGFSNLHYTTNQMQSLQMLDRGRIDITPMSELVMPAMARLAGIKVDTIENTGLKLYDSILYIVFSKETPDGIIEKWQDAINTLKRCGKYDEIYDKYFAQPSLCSAR